MPGSESFLGRGSGLNKGIFSLVSIMCHYSYIELVVLKLKNFYFLV